MKQTNSREMRLLRTILLVLTILTVINLILTASIVGLIGCILIFIMVWGIRRGNYPLTRGLSIFLFLYAGINLLVLLLALCFGGTIRLSAGIWLTVYSLSLIPLGILLRKPALQQYLKNAPKPVEKEKKITFFRGGWRDL